MRLSLLFILLFSFSVASCQSENSAKNAWTIFYYAAGCNSSEVDLMRDVAEMINGLQSQDIEIILLIDRVKGHSEDSIVLGANFTDTKLFSIRKNQVTELSGGTELPELNPDSSADLNLGDADILKRFIQFGKRTAPAQYYGLMMRSHGNGRRMCPDVEEPETDPLWIAEISDQLTDTESVNFLGLDVCSMAGLENFYQWKPGTNSFSADYILSSAPLSASWPYANIFSQIHSKFPSGTLEMTPKIFGEIHFEAIQLDQPWCSWSLIDNRQIDSVHAAIKAFEKALLEDNKPNELAKIRRACIDYHTNRDENLDEYYVQVPHLDAADYYQLISESTQFSTSTKTKARRVLEELDDLVISSYYGNGFLAPTARFQNGIGGVYQILPQLITSDGMSTTRFEEATNEWFTAEKINQGNVYGNYQWLFNIGK